MKRSFDFVLSFLGLIISFPIWIIISITIFLDSGLPIFYSQKRVGKDGVLFNTYKFRSMIPESDERYGPLQASELDKRITRVGRFLRYTAMDELPQLLSIVKGDMSFVGPRALLPSEIEIENDGSSEISIKDIPGYEQRHMVKPGLTGIAQIYAPRDINRKNKFRYDNLYIKKQSFFLDIRLILLSFWITFRGKWEYRGKKF